MRSAYILVIIIVALTSVLNVWAHNFTDNGDKTVTDNRTGFMWQQMSDTEHKWESAITYCEELNLAGYNDWRLPNINELRSIVDYELYSPSLDEPALDETYFPNTEAYYFWTSTSSSLDASKAWTIYFGYGNDYSYEKSSYKFYARCVR